MCTYRLQHVRAV